MTYKIIDIQGIGPVYAEKLIGIGIETVDQLLEKGADPKGRQAIEDATGIDHGRVLTWVNHADLFRVKGIGPQFSDKSNNLYSTEWSLYFGLFLLSLFISALSTSLSTL